jgi:hypothetical protein
MSPWEKTLANFRAKKASGDPYWNAGEMVPVHELLPYREYDRRTQPKYPGHYEEVRDHIREHGITDMGILSYNPDTHRVYASEGNTRLAVAQELGFTHVPVRVYRSGHQKRVGGPAPRPWDPATQGRPPADIRPSQIGFTAMKDLEETRLDQIRNSPLPNPDDEDGIDRYSWSWSPTHGNYIVSGFHNHWMIGRESPDHHERELGTRHGWAAFNRHSRTLHVHDYDSPEHKMDPPQEIIDELSNYHHPREVNIVRPTRRVGFPDINVNPSDMFGESLREAYSGDVVRKEIGWIQPNGKYTISDNPESESHLDLSDRELARPGSIAFDSTNKLLSKGAVRFGTVQSPRGSEHYIHLTNHPKAVRNAIDHITREGGHDNYAVTIHARQGARTFWRSDMQFPTNRDVIQHLQKYAESCIMNDDVNKLLQEAAKFLEGDTQAGASTFGSNPTQAFNKVSQAPTPQSKVKAVIDTALKKTAMEPMESRVIRMLQQVQEGTFDWHELDRLYGADFRDIQQPETAVDVHPAYGDVADLLSHHGYMPNQPEGRKTAHYIHPDGFTVDVDPHNLEWNHYSRGYEWTAAGKGLGDLNQHLRNFHRAW